MSNDFAGAPLRSTLADDPEMAELAEMFVQELPQRTGAIERAWSDGKLDDLRRLAHQLRGSSASYGFEPIGTTAGQVEDAIKSLASASPELTQVKASVDELIALCTRAMRG